MEIIILGVSMFTAIVVALVLVILFAKSKLVSSGDVTININGDPEKAVTTAAGGKCASRCRAVGRPIRCAVAAPAELRQRGQRWGMPLLSRCDRLHLFLRHIAGGKDGRQVGPCAQRDGAHLAVDALR